MSQPPHAQNHENILTFGEVDVENKMSLSIT